MCVIQLPKRIPVSLWFTGAARVSNINIEVMKSCSEALRQDI